MLNMMKTYAESYLRNEEGQGMAEYGLILALVAVIAIAGLVLLGPTLSDIFTDVNDQLTP